MQQDKQTSELTTATMAAALGAMNGVTVPAEAATSVNVFGVQVDIGLTGQDTGGAYALYQVSCEPGIGSPPHVHTSDDEAFLIIEGEWEFLRGQEVFTAGPGTFVSLPRHIAHYFKNVGQGRGRMVGIATPAGHEHFFEDASRLAFPPDPEQAIAVCQKHGIQIVPPGK